jgi:hypothetical protein
LHSGQRDHRTPPGRAVGFYNPAYGDLLYSVIVEFDLKIDRFAQQLPFGNVLGKAGKTGEGIAGKYAAIVAYHIALVIVFGWLYEDDPDLLLRNFEFLSHGNIGPDKFY